MAVRQAVESAMAQVRRAREERVGKITSHAGEQSARPKPSEAFARHFGEQHGAELPPAARYAHRPLSFAEDGNGRSPACLPDRRKLAPR